MSRRLPAAVMAALFIFGAIAAPAPARATSTQTPIAPEPFDSLTVRFAYNTTVGTAVSDDGKTREIQFDAGPSFHVVNSSGGYGNGGGSSSAPFVVTSLTPTKCSVSGRIIRYLATGTCTLLGSKDGDMWHQPVSKTISVTVFAPARATVSPRIRQVGKIAYGTRGTWVGSPTPSYKYQWYSCTTAQRTRCSAISGARSVNLMVTSKIAGKYAFLRVYMYQYGYERARTDSNVIKISAK